MKPIALVTGSSSGIGRAAAVRLSRDGFHLLVHYLKNRDGALGTLEEIHSNGGTGDLLCFDVKDSAKVEIALDEYFPPTGDKKIDVLVNNAGIHQDNLAGLMSDEAFDAVLRTNTYGAFYVSRWCVRRMIRQRHGCIVNVSSLSAQTGNAGQINYAASKAALIAMTKTLAMEVGSRGIRVNAVAPGLVATEMVENVPNIEELKKRIPLGRFAKPEEVAGVISFLCSQDASYMTGQTVSVNGGLFPA
jgi:3-oxoacyl-[acyl-carrier protein] reductase